MTITKSLCRSNARRILNSLMQESDSLKLKSKLISERLLELLSSKEYLHNKIGGYYPLSDEVNWLCEQELNLSFPQMVSDHKMIFKACSKNELIEIKAFGKTFMEPPEESKIVVPEIILVPGLSFDRKGNRLGRGKGFYDRYLDNKEYKNKYITIGLCFSEQIIDEVPVDELDVGMDFVITDKELIEIDNRRER